MADPTELALTSAQAAALSGTTETNTGTIFCTIGDAEYYTEDYSKEAINNRILQTVNELRVVKDGDLTYGVWSGLFRNGLNVVSYAGAATQALTDDATNYIYLTATGTLTKNTTGFPTDGTRHVPLATIATGSASAAAVSGEYNFVDITDYRGRAIFSVMGGEQVEANTAGVGSPNVLTAAETGKVLTNEGAGALNYHTLPTAVAGLTFTFVVDDANGIRITAASGDTIRIGATVSKAAGYIDSTTVGDTVVLIAVNATEWYAVPATGTWTVEIS